MFGTHYATLPHAFTMAARAHIQLYYDIVSPYSYIAFETLTRYAKADAWNFDLELCPVRIEPLARLQIHDLIQ